MHAPARLLLPIAAALVLSPGCRPGASDPPAAEVDAPNGTVTVEVNMDSGTQTFQVENVAAGTTVESVMRSIDQIPVTIRGQGITAFVEGIGDTATSSSEGWTYRIDGELAGQGIGSTTVDPPATISWSYGDASAIEP